MHFGSNGATILLFQLLFCYVSNVCSYLLKKNVPVIDVLRERAWCAEVEDAEQFLQIDLGQVATITGVATRKDDTATEFKLSYKKHNHGPWYFYEEDEREKIFRVNEKSKGHFSRHWLRHKFQARYLRFDVTKWTHSICFNVEIYGWAIKKMGENIQNRRKLPTLHELSMEPEESEDDQKLEEDSDGFDSSPPKPPTQEKESNRSLTITVCFIVTAIIAILASIIVCKWERHERKIRPDYLRANK